MTYTRKLNNTETDNKTQLFKTRRFKIQFIILPGFLHTDGHISMLLTYSFLDTFKIDSSNFSINRRWVERRESNGGTAGRRQCCPFKIESQL